MLSKFTACFVVASSYLLSVPLSALAKPVDGYFSLDFHFGSYIEIRNGLFYRPRGPQGIPFAQSGFIEISPYMIREKSTGEYYCSDFLKLSNGRTAKQEYYEKMNKDGDSYTVESFSCTAEGWKYYKRRIR